MIAGYLFYPQCCRDELKHTQSFHTLFHAVQQTLLNQIFKLCHSLRLFFCLVALLIVISGNDAQYIFFLYEMTIGSSYPCGCHYHFPYLFLYLSEMVNSPSKVRENCYLSLPPLISSWKIQKWKKNENKLNNHIENCKLA